MNKRGAAALFFFIALIYSPSLTSPVFYDDASHVRDNPAFRLPITDFLAGLLSQKYFSFASERTYQPLVTLFHYATHDYPLIYRLFGLGLHALNAVLVYQLALRLAAGRRPATLAAALFAAFPCSTELLNFSSFKGHLFAASCTLAVVLAVIELCAGKQKKSLPLIVCSLFIVGLLCKESALVAVPLALLYVLLFDRSAILRQKRLGLFLASTSLIYLWFRFFYLTPPPPFPMRFEYSSLASLAFYLRTLIIPYPLCLERTLPNGISWALWICAFGAIGWSSRKSQPKLFCLGWMLLALLPFLHLIPFSNVTPVADRYLYLASAGFALLLACTLGRAPRGERVLAAICVVWISITFSRNKLYRSPRLLFEQTAACAPDNPRAHFLLGNVLYQEGDLAGAKASYERVLSITDSAGARAALKELSRLEAPLH